MRVLFHILVGAMYGAVWGYERASPPKTIIKRGAAPISVTRKAVPRFAARGIRRRQRKPLIAAENRTVATRCGRSRKPTSAPSWTRTKNPLIKSQML
jgi:hypothetical protein